MESRRVFFVAQMKLHTLPETNSSPLKINGWKLADEFSFWDCLFAGALLVSGSVSGMYRTTPNAICEIN